MLSQVYGEEWGFLVDDVQALRLENRFIVASSRVRVRPGINTSGATMDTTNPMVINGFVGLVIFYVAMRAEASSTKPTDSPGSALRNPFWRLLKWAGLLISVVSFAAAAAVLIWPQASRI